MEEGFAGGPSRGHTVAVFSLGNSFLRQAAAAEGRAAAAAAAAAAAVVKATVGSGKAGFGSRVDSYRDGVGDGWRRGLWQVYTGAFKDRRKAFFLSVLKATLGSGKGGFGSRVDSHWQGVSVWRRVSPAGLRGA